MKNLLCCSDAKQSLSWNNSVNTEGCDDKKDVFVCKRHKRVFIINKSDSCNVAQKKIVSSR